MYMNNYCMYSDSKYAQLLIDAKYIDPSRQQCGTDTWVQDRIYPIPWLKRICGRICYY